VVFYYSSDDGLSWDLKQGLHPSGGAAYDYFGSSVSIFHKNKAAVGAWGSDVAAGGGGAVYTYRMVDGIWTQQQVIVSPTPAAFEWFGGSVSVSQHFLAVGAVGTYTT
jgi:hypothetical protein